jgi:hypothetical protein
MKKTLIAIFIGLNLVADVETARAQIEEIPVPKPPYLAPVPDYGHWMVKFKYKQAGPPSAAVGAPAAATDTPPPAPAAPAPPDEESPVSIETIKTGELRGVTLTFADGTSKQFTCQGDWVLNSTPNGPQLSIAMPTALPYPYYTTGFIMLDGAKINPSTFKEAAKHNGVMAFHYHSGDVEVWIDPDTMLPMVAKQGGVEVTYQFLTPPPRPFPIPKDQENLLQQEQAALKATSSMR